MASGPHTKDTRHMWDTTRTVTVLPKKEEDGMNLKLSLTEKLLKKISNRLLEERVLEEMRWNSTCEIGKYDRTG